MNDGETQISGAPPPHLRPTRLEPGDAFGMRYRIIRELGAGGMGVVYQAWDEVLGVAVAMKVIRRTDGAAERDLADVERRFKRELLLARQVTHRNVVRIHDLGDVEGTKYITMTYVDGEGLASTLLREGTLPVPRVLHLARQIASALEAAHEANVVHRDLKPANIMIDGEDHALLMDFGIAQSATAAATGSPAATPAQPSTSGDQTMMSPAGETFMAPAGETMMAPAGETMLTPGKDIVLFPPSGGGSRVSAAESVTVGHIVGTLDYMSPEQSRGAAVDHRTDIYAFGLILTDLLIGRRTRPEGMTPWAALTERVAQTPEPIAKRDPSVPAAFDAVITKCLQLDPKDRYLTTGELVAALARLDDNGNLIPEPVVKRMSPAMMAVAGVGVAAMIGGTYWLARGNGPVEHKPVSVLIADFANNSNNPVFSGLVEQALSVGVESASFISAFPHRDAMRVVRAIKAGPTLDESTLRLK